VQLSYGALGFASETHDIADAEAGSATATAAIALLARMAFLSFNIILVSLSQLRLSPHMPQEHELVVRFLGSLVVLLAAGGPVGWG